MGARLTAIRTDHSRRLLRLDWADDFSAELPHALLRSRCACAECRQLQRTRRLPASDGVTIEDIEPYGANAVQLKFSDRHARGIFPFEYLRALAEEVNAQRA